MLHTLRAECERRGLTPPNWTGEVRNAEAMKATSAPKNWSSRVTRESRALILEDGVFTWNNPKRIAESLKQSADNSHQRKAGPFQSAMSMLNFYINRAGKNLPDSRRIILEKAKTELRKLYGKHHRN